MFDTSTYVARRARLAQDIGSGVLLFLGNAESPMNYTDNQYPFRQDSSFLYFCGLDSPNLAAMVDVDARQEVIFGDELTMDDIIWSGPQKTLAERAETVGVDRVEARGAVARVVEQAAATGRHVHFLPQYRADNALLLQQMTGIPAERVNDRASVAFIRAVVAQRAIKSPEEVGEIETALDATREMHLLAMRLARPGVYEREVAGAMEGIAVARGGRLSFPVIFSVHGETLHNHSHANLMEQGQIAVNDSGAESAMGYAGDITRTIPIGGQFTGVRRDLYQAVLRAQLAAIDAIQPSVPYKTIHLLAARSLAEDLVALGCMRGDVEAAVEAGAHALFFPHGLGHMLGLDVHDMEGLGEDYVGYDESVQRSMQFGLKSLRLARPLQPGFVLTVEPGVYFIPALIDRWEAERRHEAFIDYAALKSFRDAGGIRIEDNVLVTEDGGRVLGLPIAKEMGDVERLAGT